MSPEIKAYPVIKNEPKIPRPIKDSFAFVPSAGMRLAPEELVLELMREVFFVPHYGEPTGNRALDPDEQDAGKNYRYSERERAVLHALRGRRKEKKQSKMQRFFTPTYPQLARQAWFGKNRERVVKNFLLSGPIAQHLWQRGQGTEEGGRNQQDLVNKIAHALRGNNSCLDQNLNGKDLLAATLGPESFDTNLELAKENLREKTKNNSVMKTGNDELADRITQDLIAICDLEPKLPRMQWLQVLMTFLRFALPMWLLAQMQITKLLHKWLLDAMTRGHIVDTNTILRESSRRNRGLLHPTLTPTRELFEHVDQYMKHRVELSILIYNLEWVSESRIQKKILNLDGGDKGHLSVGDLLMIARDASKDVRSTERFKQVAGDNSIDIFLAREGEQYLAWRNPRKSGQGKNIDEFFRVLYKAESGDEGGGYLLIPVGRGQGRGFRVFPGQLLLKTMTYLATQDKWSNRGGGGGMLVLKDVEDHFAQYGIDFSTAADARPILMNELRAMGLLTGSPDAGSSVAVRCPY